MSTPIHVIDGARTPFLKARNRPGPFAAADLATDAGRALLLRQPFAPTDIDEVILGCAAPSVDEVNIGRVVALRMGCGHNVPGWTVMRLSLIHISEPTRLLSISYAVFCLKKKI